METNGVSSINLYLSLYAESISLLAMWRHALWPSLIADLFGSLIGGQNPAGRNAPSTLTFGAGRERKMKEKDA